MISWRYHVVSLVAVVLAFGLGILAGTSVVGDDLVRELQENTNAAQQARAEAVALAGLYEQFVVGLQPTLRDGVLAGEEAIVITMDGADGPAQVAVEELAAAGADVLASLELTRRLAETDLDENAAAVEEVLGLVGSDPDTLSSRIADALAGRLAEGPLEPESDVLGDLLEAGLVTADRDLDEAALLGIGGAGQLVVVAAGSAAPTGSPPPGLLLVPLAERLVELDVATTAVGPTDDPYGFVAAVRGAPGIQDCSMVTVDDIDVEGVGGITMVMGIDRFLADEDPAFRPGGDYGLDGDSMLPGADEPPQSCRR